MFDETHDPDTCVAILVPGSRRRTFKAEFKQDFVAGGQSLTIDGIPTNQQKAEMLARVMLSANIEALECKYVIANGELWVVDVLGEGLGVADSFRLMSVVGQAMGLALPYTLPVWSKGDWQAWAKWAKACKTPYGDHKIGEIRVVCVSEEKEEMWTIS